MNRLGRVSTALFVAAFSLTTSRAFAAIGAVPSGPLLGAVTGPLTPAQFHQVGAAHLAQFLTLTPVAGLDHLAGLAGAARSEVPQMDALRVSAETLLDVMTAPPASHPAEGKSLHRQLADKMGADNLKTAGEMGAYFHEKAKTDEALAKKMSEIRARFSPQAEGGRFDFYGTLTKLDEFFDRSIRLDGGGGLLLPKPGEPRKD